MSDNKNVVDLTKLLLPLIGFLILGALAWSLLKHHQTDYNYHYRDYDYTCNGIVIEDEVISLNDDRNRTYIETKNGSHYVCQWYSQIPKTL